MIVAVSFESFCDTLEAIKEASDASLIMASVLLILASTSQNYVPFVQ